MHFVYPILAFHILHFLIQNTCLYEQPKQHDSLENVDVEREENDFYDKVNANKNHSKLRRKFKRNLVDSKLDEDGFTYYNIGVLMASRLDSPFDLERCGPAVDLGIEKINKMFLKHHKIKLNKVQER